MSDIHTNDKYPSSADSLSSHDSSNDTSSVSNKVEEARKAAEELMTNAKERGSKAYDRGNAAVAEYIDPLPGMLLAAAAGFVIGALWASAHRDRRRYW